MLSVSKIILTGQYVMVFCVSGVTKRCELRLFTHFVDICGGIVGYVLPDTVPLGFLLLEFK